MQPKLFLLLFAGAILFSTSINAQKKFELADVAKLVNISDPQISPDGKTIVVVVSRPDYTQNRYNAELVLIDIASGKQSVLTQDRPSVAQPRWSPDGTQLAFLSRVGTGKEAANQIFILSMFGGDAKQITKTAKGIQHYAWSPNAETIAFVTADEPKNKKELEKGYTDFEAGNNDMFIGAQPTPSHIWMVNLITGIYKRLTSGDWSLPVTIPPGAPSSPLSWSADGNSILFVKQPTAYSGDGQLRTIQQLNLSDSSIKPLTNRNKFESYPTFSADGNSICYWYKKAGINESINEIWITGKNAGEGKNLTSKFNRDVYRSIWMPDNKSLLIGGHDDNKTSLWILSPDGNTTNISLGDISPVWSFWLDASVAKNGAIAFIGSGSSQPNELYYLPSVKAKPIKLTDFNAAVKGMTLGKTETIRWETDGWKNNGIVTYPVNYQAGKKYPLVLVIHGGPNAASVEQFSRFSQLLANEGFFVFEPNYRGSDNLGSEYKLAIVKDAGAGPGRDVMDGLAKLKASGMIDTAKIGVSGWSYGGYMTVWLAGHYPGWAAVMSGAAVTDLVDQYNLTDGNAARSGMLGGSPWTGDNMQRYIEQSPITAARNIKAPTLILANTADPRVVISNSYKLYHSLKDNGTPVKFIAWPVPAHNASDPVTQMQRDKLWIGWMNEYLK